MCVCVCVCVCVCTLLNILGCASSTSCGVWPSVFWYLVQPLAFFSSCFTSSVTRTCSSQTNTYWLPNHAHHRPRVSFHLVLRQGAIFVPHTARITLAGKVLHSPPPHTPTFLEGDTWIDGRHAQKHERQPDPFRLILEGTGLAFPCFSILYWCLCPQVLQVDVPLPCTRNKRSTWRPTCAHAHACTRTHTRTQTCSAVNIILA